MPDGRAGGLAADGAPDGRPWLVSFPRSLAEQIRRLGLKLDRDRLVPARLPELSVAIVELARAHGRVTMADAVRATGANHNTLKLHLRRLVADGAIVQHGKGRGAWYGLV